MSDHNNRSAGIEDERKVILDILVKAARVRECFHSFCETMKNAAGNDVFIDATKIDGAIATIRARTGAPDAPMTDHNQSSADIGDSRLPLQYQDGPDYCTVKDAQGHDFALTMQPDLMKAMERALSDEIASLIRAPARAAQAPSDPFNRKQVEAICRAVCAVEGVDPDDDVFGDGCDAQWTRYADAVASALSSTDGEYDDSVSAADVRGILAPHPDPTPVR